jgi:hypothetical protein
MRALRWLLSVFRSTARVDRAGIYERKTGGNDGKVEARIRSGESVRS